MALISLIFGGEGLGGERHTEMKCASLTTNANNHSYLTIGEEKALPSSSSTMTVCLGHAPAE